MLENTSEGHVCQCWGRQKRHCGLEGDVKLLSEARGWRESIKLSLVSTMVKGQRKRQRAEHDGRCAGAEPMAANTPWGERSRASSPRLQACTWASSRAHRQGFALNHTKTAPRDILPHASLCGPVLMTGATLPPPGHSDVGRHKVLWARWGHCSGPTVQRCGMSPEGRTEVTSCHGALRSWGTTVSGAALFQSLPPSGSDVALRTHENALGPGAQLPVPPSPTRSDFGPRGRPCREHGPGRGRKKRAGQRGGIAASKESPGAVRNAPQRSPDCTPLILRLRIPPPARAAPPIPHISRPRAGTSKWALSSSASHPHAPGPGSLPSSSRPGEGQQAALSSGLRCVLFQGRVPPASPLHPEWKYLGETGPLNSPCPSPQLSRSSTRSCCSPVPPQARSPQTRQTVSMNRK